MPWKTEIDRLVHHLVLDTNERDEGAVKRAARTVSDLVSLTPDRDASQFHIGVLLEALGPTVESLVETGEDDEDGDDDATGDGDGRPAIALPDPAGEAAERWRVLGHLDAASRAGERERVEELMETPEFEASLDHPEGRVALRSVGRMLLRDGEDERAFALYARHLEAVDEEGSRRDAEFLLEEALRRSDRGDVDRDETLARLDRAAAFAEETGLDDRACSKVDRKLGRVHQLAERPSEAAACYRRALDRLPEDDPYRSVLVGDLALSTLGVRGTLDLLPEDDRENAEEAEEILRQHDKVEGRSYNALYTLGMLAYERGDWEVAAEALEEADRLMRENRAKARIVHARARFFLAHCRIELGAEGDELEDALGRLRKDAKAVSLDDDVKDEVFDAVLEKVPDAKLPGRKRGRRRDDGDRRKKGRGRGRGKGDEDGDGGEQDGGGEAASGGRSAAHLAEAREVLENDPRQALGLVDKAFKSRPDFDTWVAAYRTRLDALIALNERDEALRTYDRFRAKLYHREALDRLEEMLREPEGTMASLLDELALQQELLDLYEVMPDRDEEFRGACVACAELLLEDGGPEAVGRALVLAREAVEREAEEGDGLLERATKAAEKAKLAVAAERASRDAARRLLADEEEPVRVLVVGGDEGRKGHADRLRALADDVGFEASWIFTGIKPPHKMLSEIEDAADRSDVLLIHHRIDDGLLADVQEMARRLDLPVRRAPWLGGVAMEDEALRCLEAAFVEDD